MTDDATELPKGGDDTDRAVDLDPVTAVKRKRFHEEDADDLAKAVGITTERLNKPTEKFAYFEDDQRFVVVAGAQEKDEVARAFARGLGLRGGRRLLLVLPEGHCFATMQRAPWFKPDAQPEIWTYGRGAPVKQRLKTREQAEEALRDRLKANQSLEAELVAATTAKHLGALSKSVWELVEWATSHGRLDPSHLKGERAWHCLGQKVLSIKGTTAGLAVRAGVHYTGVKAPEPVVVTRHDPLTEDRFKKVRAEVEAGIQRRLQSDDPQIHKADESWLQAVIRRDPKLVGVEQPALREFPAWRAPRRLQEVGTRFHRPHGRRRTRQHPHRRDQGREERRRDADPPRARLLHLGPGLREGGSPPPFSVIAIDVRDPLRDRRFSRRSACRAARTGAGEWARREHPVEVPYHPRLVRAPRHHAAAPSRCSFPTVSCHRQRDNYRREREWLAAFQGWL